MQNFDWISLLQACSPVLIAIVGIIPTIIVNRKKTQDSISNFQTQITADVKAIRQEVSDVQNQLGQHIAESDEEKVKQARYRILRFYDELCKNEEHSESHFEDILDDIDLYEHYCLEHPKFKNSRGHVAMQYIKETYHKVKAKGGFLTHSEKE